MPGLVEINVRRSTCAPSITINSCPFRDRDGNADTRSLAKGLRARARRRAREAQVSQIPGRHPLHQRRYPQHLRSIAAQIFKNLAHLRSQLYIFTMMGMIFHVQAGCKVRPAVLCFIQTMSLKLFCVPLKFLCSFEVSRR